MTIPVGFSQVNLMFTGAPLPTGAEVTFGVENLGGDPPVTVGGLVAVALDDSNVLDQTSDAVAITGIKVKNGPDSTGASAIVGLSAPGTVAGNTTAPNLAILVRKVTNLGGRRGRGRFYWPCVPEVSVGDDGTLLEPMKSDLETAFNAFLSELNSAGLPMVLLHDGPTIPTSVVDLAVQEVAGTQRRRMRR